MGTVTKHYNASVGGKEMKKILIILVTIILMFLLPHGDKNIDAAFLQFLLPLLSGLAGGLGNRGATQTGTQTSTEKGTVSPLLDPYATNLERSIGTNYLNMMPGTAGYNQYLAGGIRNINQNTDLQRQGLNSILASRGISGPAAGTALGNLENQRFGNITQWQQQAPFMALQPAAQFFSQIPFGRTEDITKTGRETQTTPGNILGGGLTGLTAMLANLFGQGSYSGSNYPNNPSALPINT